MKNKFEAGCIYRAKYLNYHIDKYPLILILHANDSYVHAINLNYLPKQLKEEVIDLIAMVATKQLPGSDTYKLYHNYIKSKLPRVIRFAYRKYFTYMFKDPVQVSKGFWHIKNFLWHIKKFDNNDKQKVIVSVRKAIKEASNEEKQDAKIQRLARLNKYASMTKEEIDKRAGEYLQEINSIYKKKFDRSNYTF